MTRVPRPLHVEPLYPGNGLPPRPGEDRPGLSPFGRLAMGQLLGKSSILIYNENGSVVQQAPVDMINVEGDDLDAQQLVVTLHPPRVIPLSFEEVSNTLDQQNLKQVAMAMRPNGPVMDRRPRRDGLDVDKVERLIVRRVAIEMKQRQRVGHGADPGSSIGRRDRSTRAAPCA